MYGFYITVAAHACLCKDTYFTAVVSVSLIFIQPYYQLNLEDIQVYWAVDPAAWAFELSMHVVSPRVISFTLHTYII